MSPDVYKGVEESISQMCGLFGLKSRYCSRVEVDVIGRVTFYLFKGAKGRCEGKKYVDENGEAAREVVVFELPPFPREDWAR